MAKEVRVYIISLVLTYEMQWYHWWCPLHYVVAMQAPMVSHDVDTSANGITWPKSHVTPHFDYPYLRNAMVLLAMLLVLCDANTSAICVMCVMLPSVPMVSHDQKGQVALHFDNLQLRNAMVPMKALLVSHDTNLSSSGIKWVKKWYCS